MHRPVKSDEPFVGFCKLGISAFGVDKFLGDSSVKNGEIVCLPNADKKKFVYEVDSDESLSKDVCGSEKLLVCENNVDLVDKASICEKSKVNLSLYVCIWASAYAQCTFPFEVAADIDTL